MTDPSEIESGIEIESEQAPTLSTGSVRKQLRIWIAASIWFATVIGYKSQFPTLNPFIDILVIAFTSSILAIFVGASVGDILKQVLQNWY
ncbi:MAG: hypothetical protein J0L70_18650 [Leptolyngbya sp. UWPOB_LEPTO1]|uniref:hypothetical protein n=1 Tax=Leptolyngbya sp. UWPOB_LEPTO1 TaxID=2815653 RepID=UPI001AC2A31C|nr:hypothetical protein [Leptolyngbya sp. UWPOB_LEPTO1]MBN8562557.1 hypothetical protein [Leptolyngbya sp. UWPOB_LEPTO1]